MHARPKDEEMEKLKRGKAEARKVEADKQEQIERLRKETQARKRYVCPACVHALMLVGQQEFGGGEFCCRRRSSLVYSDGVEA